MLLSKPRHGLHLQAVLVENASEGDGRRHPRAEDEDFGGVREAEAGGDPQGPEVTGRVGEQDDEHADTAKEIEARIAFAGSFGKFKIGWCLVHCLKPVMVRLQRG